MISIQIVKYPEFKTEFNFDKMLGSFIEKLKDYAVSITPVDTGAWRDSHETEIVDDLARVYIDPGATNPKTGAFVEDYATIVVYERTSDAIGGVILGGLEIEIVDEVFG